MDNSNVVSDISKAFMVMIGIIEASGGTYLKSSGSCIKCFAPLDFHAQYNHIRRCNDCANTDMFVGQQVSANGWNLSPLGKSLTYGDIDIAINLLGAWQL